MAECREMGSDADYHKRMMHKIPVADVVDRVPYILEKCQGKRVLNFGSAWGGLHDQIKAVASKVYGIDKVQPADFILDCDDIPEEPWPFPSLDVEIIVCGEIIEHLANPGRFLQAIRHEYKCPVLITVPNAFCEAAHRTMERKFENVNIDHVAWYSYRTLKTLVERYGYQINEFHWYNGRPKFAEGIVIIAR